MKINLAFWIAVIFMLLEVFFFKMTLGYPKEPAFVPQRLLVFMFLITALIAFKEYKNDDKKYYNLDLKFVGTLLLSILYIVVLVHFGFVISSTLFMVLTILLLGNKKPIISLLISFTFSAVLFLLFTKILTVPLPNLFRGTLL